LIKIIFAHIDGGQEDRAVRNLLNHGLAVCPMTLLIKDHKVFSIGETPPTRSVMGGNVGDNKPLSEFMSFILEPVARKMNGMEKMLPVAY
jgi:hypothetical protein